MTPIRPLALGATAALAFACLASACSSSSTMVTAPSGEKCGITVGNSPSSFGPGGGSGSVSIQTSRDCTWSITADAAWVSITGAHSGQGEAVIPFAVAPNPAPASRTGSLTVGAERVSVSQAAAPCTFSLSRTRDSIGASGGQLSVAVSTLSGCSWAAVSAVPWLTITSGQSGTASATVALSVAGNTGPSRVGTMNVAGQTYTVAQDAAAAPPPSPNPSPTPEPPPGPSPLPSPSPSPSPQVQVSGVVLAVSGKCPGITFSVSGNTVTAGKSTSYKDGKCDDVRIGAIVTVTGTRGADQVIAADVIQFNE